MAVDGRGILSLLAQDEKPTDSGLTGNWRDMLKWWLGSGKASEAAEALDPETREKRIRCIESGGRWDAENRQCVKQ